MFVPGNKKRHTLMFWPPTWSRYWHTLRHLQARQWTARLKRKLVRPTPDTRPAPLRRTWEAARWQHGIEPPRSLLAPGKLRLLNEEHELSSLAALEPALSHLWRYHAHYFDDLRAAEVASRTEMQRQWVETWLRECPPGTTTAWDPYPTSLRIVNWLKWVWQGGPLSARSVAELGGSSTLARAGFGVSSARESSIGQCTRLGLRRLRFWWGRRRSLAALGHGALSRAIARTNLARWRTL